MDKNTRRVSLIILVLLLILTAAFGVVQTVNAKKYERKFASDETRAFYELTENVEKIDVALMKAALASDSYQLIKTAAAIRECSAFAISDLSELSSGDSGAEKITAFLNQAGDYTKSLALIHSDGSAPSKEESETFLKLSRHASKLKEALLKIKSQVSSGEMSLYEAEKAIPTFGDGITNIETEKFKDYEALNYDGPFSEHMNTLDSVMLKTLPEESAETALKKAMDCLGGKVVLVLSEETDGVIPSYVFIGDSQNAHYSVEITKNGAMPLSMTCGRVFSEPKISDEECLNIAKDYLASIGYDALIETYRENSGTSFTFNFAPTEKAAVLYPDLIKVSVGTDNGAVTGFEAHGYLMNHKERNLPEPNISKEDALSSLNGNFKPQSVRTAVIPTEYAEELYCYELSGTYNDKTFLIYVNAQTGRQEEILLLEESNANAYKG